jgi:DNA-directed RNA polymerase, mitochondrial
MILRTAYRVESTLVSRQALPRPARLYSTPSKRASAPALATANAPAQPPLGYVPYAHTPGDEIHPLSSDMQGFLRRRTSYTIIPPPLPGDRSGMVNEYFFTDSPTQDLLAIMDACLHNLYDVPRAKSVFERLRSTRAGDPILQTRLYNSFMEAYIDMATEREPDKRSFWVREAYNLYQIMQSRKENIGPSASTYALILIAWRRSIHSLVRNDVP